MASTPVYQWREGIFPVPAQIAGERLAALARVHGAVTPAAVVEDARPADAPLHACFEWDDTAAATQYRLAQAAQLIHCVVVQPRAADDDVATRRVVVRAAPAVPPIDATARHRAQRRKLLRDAVRELEALRRRYRTLTELAPVFAALEQAERDLRAQLDALDVLERAG